MEAPRYYVIGGDGRPYGPAGADTVREWLREGRVNHLSQGNVVGTLDWRPLREFAEFTGTPPPTAPPQPPPPLPATPTGAPRRTHPLAVAGFLCGLVSLSCCACCGGELLGILAVVLSTIAFVEISRRPMEYDGRGLAIAGIVLGALGMILGLIGTGAGLAASLAEGGRPHRFH